MIYREYFMFDAIELEETRKAILKSSKSAEHRCIGIADVIQSILPTIRRSDAKSTWSCYLTLPDNTELRISDHSKTVWLGMNKRNNTASTIEINADWTAVKLAKKILSIKKCLEN